MKKLLMLLGISLLCAIPFSVFAQSASCPEHLFVISKSDNANVLYYDVVKSGNTINGKNPVDMYWIMNAERGQREGLTMLEKPQFGIKTREVVPGKEYVINVRNDVLSPRDIHVVMDDEGCARAKTTLNGQNAYLDNIYIQIKPQRSLIPSVQYLDITGTSVNDGSNVSERVYAK